MRIKASGVKLRQHARMNQSPPMAAQVIPLDVRGFPPPEPLERVLAAVGELQEQQELLVIHHREPLLLYPYLDELGLVHQARCLAPMHWEIRILRPAAAGGSTAS